MVRPTLSLSLAKLTADVSAPSFAEVANEAARALENRALADEVHDSCTKVAFEVVGWSAR